MDNIKMRTASGKTDEGECCSTVFYLLKFLDITPA